MRMRPITVLAAALALLSCPAAWAQDPTPTPTATAGESQSASSAGAPKDATKEVKQIYDDYRGDGKIDACNHAREDLQKALDTIEPAFDSDYPDFRVALEAGIKLHDRNGCANEDNGSATATPTPSVTATATSTPNVGTVPPSASPSSTPESGRLPQDSSGDGTAATPPESGATPAPTAAPTVAPPVATPPPTAAVTASPTPTPVIMRTAHGSLVLPLTLLGAALLGIAGLAVFAVASRRSPRLSHAWREAAFRTRGTWADFADWLRFGR